MTRCFFKILVGIFFLQISVATAEDNNRYLKIIKEEGTPPKVSAKSVDLFGADELHKLFGEDFLVFVEETELSSSDLDIAYAPIKFPSGNINPIIPVCQCPEDYIASLEERFKSIDLTPRPVQNHSAASIQEGIMLKQFNIDAAKKLEIEKLSQQQNIISEN